MEEYTANMDTLILLGKQILTELQLLTLATKVTALERFQGDFLTTDQQRKIYDAIDGEKDSQAIADATGAALRSVQVLIKDLQERDLIEVTKKSKANIPSKSIAKIATYYAKLDIANNGGNENE